MDESTVQLDHTAREVDEGINRSVDNAADISELREEYKKFIQEPIGGNALYGRRKEGDVYSWGPINAGSIGTITANIIRYSIDADKSAGLGKAVSDLETALGSRVMDIPNTTSALYVRRYNGSTKEWLDIASRLPQGIDILALTHNDYCPSTIAVKDYVEYQFNNARIPVSKLTFDPVDRILDYSIADAGSSNYTARYIKCPSTDLVNDKITSITIVRASNTGVDYQAKFLIIAKKEGSNWIQIGCSNTTTIIDTVMETTYDFDKQVSLRGVSEFYIILSRTSTLSGDTTQWSSIRTSVNPAGSTHAMPGIAICPSNSWEETNSYSARIVIKTDYYRQYVFPGTTTKLYSYNNRIINACIFNDLNNHAIGAGSLAEGISTTAGDANVYAAHAEGYTSKAYGAASHAEGYGSRTEINSQGAHAEGYATTAAGLYSHAEGLGANLSGLPKVREYQGAVGRASHTEGGGITEYGAIMANDAIGDGSHAEGALTEATGSYSHAEGLGNVAIGTAAHIEGQYANTDHHPIHAVGIGEDGDHRKNAHEIAVDGSHYIYGVGGYIGDNSNEQNTRTLQKVVNTVDEFVKLCKGSMSLRYNINSVRLNDEFDDILRMAKKSSTAIKNDDTQVDYSDAQALFTYNSTSQDIRRIVYSGDTSHWASIPRLINPNSLDRLFWYQADTIDSNYANSALISELDYLDCSSSTSMCSVFECSMMARINKILPTINMTAATGMFYYEGNKTVGGHAITDNLVYLAGFDCSSLTEYYHFILGWQSSKFHPLAEAFKGRSNITNLPILRNLQISLRDGNMRYGSDKDDAASSTHFYNLSKMLGDDDTRSEAEKVQNVVDFFDSLGVARLRLIDPSTTSYSTSAGSVGVITFHANVFDRIKNYVSQYEEVRLALKYAMLNKNWMFFKNIDNSSTREYLTYETH